MSSPFLFLAALYGFLGVSLGAFGAHGLKNILTEHGLEIYKTAVSYQMYHALALGLIALLPKQTLLNWAGYLFAVGILLFSGSLYLLALLDNKWLGIITPFGGLAFLAAWGILAYTGLKKNQE